MGRVIGKVKSVRSCFSRMHLAIFFAKMFALAISRGNDSNENYYHNENHPMANDCFFFLANSCA